MVPAKIHHGEKQQSKIEMDSLTLNNFPTFSLEHLSSKDSLMVAFEVVEDHQEENQNKKRIIITQYFVWIIRAVHP